MSKKKEQPKAFVVVVSTSEEEGQATLEKFKVKTKTSPRADLMKFIGEKLEQLAGILDTDYGGVIGSEKDQGYINALTVAQKSKLRTEKELTADAIIKEATALGIQEWRINIEDAKVCISCEGAIDSNDIYPNENGDGVLCVACWEGDHSEHVTVVKFSDDDDPLESHTIGDYHNDTDGEFKVVWHRTDGWRGYSEIVPSKNWKKLHSDAGLSMSEDEQNLADFDKALRAQLNKLGIRWARVISPTSNIFCVGYDFYVEAKKFKQAEQLCSMLAKTWRDPREFAITAMTGKSPRECDKTDLAFAAIGTAIMSRANKEGGPCSPP